MKEELLAAIKKTAARFDVFDFPLTEFELWQFLPYKISFAELRAALAESGLEQHDALYTLPGRSSIIETRRLRYRESEKKIKIAKRRLKLISWIPFIRLIALANIIGPHNLKAQSDLDLFIVTKKDRIWLVKLIATSIVALLGLRPTEKKSANQLCLSFLADDSALNLQNCALGTNDWYFSYWLAGIVPLFGSSEAYNELISANAWLREQLPNFKGFCPKPRRRFSLHARKASTFAFWNLFEKIAKRLNNLLMSSALKKAAKEQSGVIISDHLLKLHIGDRRRDLFAAAETRSSSL